MRKGCGCRQSVWEAVPCSTFHLVLPKCSEGPLTNICSKLHKWVVESYHYGALNYNYYVKNTFGDIDRHSFACRRLEWWCQYHQFYNMQRGLYRRQSYLRGSQ